MKSATTLTVASTKGAFQKLRTICLHALSTVDNARQACLAAGQMLNELKERCDKGDFMDSVAQAIPEISHDTVNIWMRAAANIARALPPVPDVIDVETLSISQILSTPDSELPAVALGWKQGWLDFTADKTIKECLNGVFVDGDDAHRTDRAINGKTKGGSGGDRKDFPLFVAVKLKDMGVHFSHWAGMNDTQKTEAKTAIVAAITGDALNLRKRNFNFAVWPEEICEVALEALKARMKGAK